MRRFSDRSHLVTLSEINITPLLDLAFVLLIIFVITTPLLEQSINLKLPKGGRTNQVVEKSNIRTVEVSSTGYYLMEKQRFTPAELVKHLAEEGRANPHLICYLRADKDCRYELLAKVFDTCQRNGITIAMATDPKPDR
jgi:biopolymer transport protein ExbD